MQKPSLGRIVLVKVDPSMNNGSDTVPAIICRTFDNDMVNVRVQLDSFACPLWMTSLMVFDTEEQAVAHGSSGCYWPPRVS